jgi:hypothetical protein
VKNGDLQQDDRTEPQTTEGKASSKNDRDKFEHGGNKYGQTDSYEKLTGLARELRENNERLPFDDYQKLRAWIENKDRERFSGYPDKGIQQAIKDTR